MAMSRWIDADALKKDVARLHVLNDEAEIRRAYEYNPHATSTDFEETLVSVFDAIEDAPSIEPKRGEWTKRTKHTLIAQVNFAYCSECGQPIMHEHTRALWNFCPNCGADMREREGE